jgi:hypothetical protein
LQHQRDDGLTTDTAFTGHRTLQASPRPSNRSRPQSKLTLATSTFFRRNYTMLGFVFAGAFAFELYVAA